MAFERLQPAVDAHPRGGGGGAERASDIRVLEVLQHAQAHGLALVRRQGVEQLVGSVGPGALGHRILDALRTVKPLLQASAVRSSAATRLPVRRTKYPCTAWA